MNRDEQYAHLAARIEQRSQAIEALATQILDTLERTQP